jgi:membrane protein
MADDKPGIVGEAKATVADVRRRFRLLDHVLNMLKHYSNVQGNVLAGAVTYFGFLSFFPLLALSFAVVGYISHAYPDAQDSLVTAIQQIFPGIVTTNGAGNTISMNQIQDAANIAGIIGFVGVVYSGLNWVSGLRQALQSAFQVPPSKKYNFVVGKGVDIIVLGILGIVLIVSVGISGVVKGLADKLISWVGLSGSFIGTPLVWTIGILLGMAASTLLFFVMYRILGDPDLDAKPLWQGAILGALGFEVLKILVVYVLGAVGGSSFAPLAIAVTLVVWINYFSRLVMYGAAWAMTAEASAATLALWSARQLAAETQEALGSLAVPVGAKPEAAVTSSGTLSGRFDPGSAIAGAAAGIAAYLLFWRE